MTTSEFRAVCAARWGMGWQQAVARALKISDRQIRRYAAGAALPEGVAKDLYKVLGIDAAETAWPRDEWIIGDGSEQIGGDDDEDGDRQYREYIIHTRYPRFIARVAANDLDEGAVDELSGVTLGDELFTLCEINWIDRAPPDPASILRKAAKIVNEAG